MPGLLDKFPRSPAKGKEINVFIEVLTDFFIFNFPLKNFISLFMSLPLQHLENWFEIYKNIHHNNGMQHDLRTKNSNQ